MEIISSNGTSYHDIYADQFRESKFSESKFSEVNSILLHHILHYYPMCSIQIVLKTYGFDVVMIVYLLYNITLYYVMSIVEQVRSPFENTGTTNTIREDSITLQSDECIDENGNDLRVVHEEV